MHGIAMPQVGTIVAEQQRGGVWNARFAHSDRFVGEGECPVSAIWRLIDDLGSVQIELDQFAEVDELRRDNYRVFRVPLTEGGRICLRDV